MVLSQTPAKRCQTAAGFALRDGKILLVLHKKLGIWLAPGGHVEENELPHQAAEREFLEETGIVGRAISAYPMLSSPTSEPLPLPFTSNLHWINKQRGSGFCEQHYVFGYFIHVSDMTPPIFQKEEVDEIGWFGKDEVSALHTDEGIRNELLFVFDHFPSSDLVSQAV